MFVHLLASLAFAPVDFSFRAGEGLTIRMNGVEVVRGSSFQYYEPGWTKGYFSSTWQPTDVRAVDADTFELTFKSGDGNAFGSERVHRDGEKVTAHYKFEWVGETPAKVELTAGMIWAPGVEAGSLQLDGKAGRAPAVAAYKSDTDMTERRFGADAKSFVFAAPLGNLEVKTSSPTTLFDARGYKQDYAEGKSVLWFGALDLDVAKGKPNEFDVEWTAHPNAPAASRTEERKATTSGPTPVFVPPTTVEQLIPKPRTAQLDYDKPVTLTNLFVFPAGRVRYWDVFKDSLARRFEVPPPVKGAPPMRIDGGTMSDLKMKPGGYTIDITPTSASILGQDDEGLRHAMVRLAQMAFVHNGELALPTGHMADEPTMGFRGVHMFVGPEAREFQKRLTERVLIPLGFNEVVLECERTNWKTTPVDAGHHPISTEELKGIFDDFRAVGIEPIPLIQSLGHMDWFFAGGKRLELAMNPQVPYTLDPRKKGTKPATVALWDEAIELLKPAKIHFGCDEIDQEGMAPHDPALTTSIWREQMATLAEIAKKHHVTPMLWGDMALAPGEATDATNGDTKEEAYQRRGCIPEGAMVCDWHYKADPEPEGFVPSLRLWKKENYFPIGATWYKPENIRGFDIAADREKTGTLQTTWPGYDISERVMVDNLNQFTAMVLAGDYSWSGRRDRLDQLGYDPGEVFRKLYFGQPVPVRPVVGTELTWGKTDKEIQIGSIKFAVGEPLALRTQLVAGRESGPTTFDISVSAKGSHIGLAIDTSQLGSVGEAVADVRIELADGQTVERKIVYGHHVRAASDTMSTPYAERSAEGQCAVRIDFDKPSSIRSIRIEGRGQAGFRLYGITVW